MSDLAVLGDFDSIMGFRALGLDAYPYGEPETLDEEEIRPQLREIVRESGAKVLFVTEPFYQKFSELLETLRGQAVFPLFVPIPNNRGSLGSGADKVKALVAKAIGADIFGDDKQAN